MRSHAVFGELDADGWTLMDFAVGAMLCCACMAVDYLYMRKEKIMKKKNSLKYFALALSAAFLMGALGACGETSDTSTEESTSAVDADTDADDVSSEDESSSTSDSAFVGSFVITLYPDIAPITCENFENLVEEGFYDGLTFHRVVDDFMAQGGDPNGNGTGGSDQTIKGEFSENGVENTLSHTKGIVSMARSSDNDSASSQFFICYTNCSFLDGSYAAFGEVTEGMEVVESFLEVERSLGSDNAISSPNMPIVMEEVKMIDDDEDGNPRVQITMNDFLNESE